MEIATIYPDRITVRQKAPYRNQDASIALIKRLSRIKSNQNLGKEKSKVSLSPQSKRKLLDSIQLMQTLSPKRTVEVNKKTKIYNFQTTFLTLTLPAEQMHTDVEIKKALNGFLTNARRYLKMKNYVWKAELQKNENIHFHIITDVFVSYNSLRYFWNKSLESLGYIEKYKQRFENMTLYEYAKCRGLKVEDCRQAYAKGKRDGWSKPNSVDVRAVKSSKSLSFYLAKYFTKSIKSQDKKEGVAPEDEERIKHFGRVWSRSESLSKIKLITRWDWSNIKDNIGKAIEDVKQFKRVAYDYCVVYYFDLHALKGWAKRYLTANLIRQAKYFRYPFPDFRPNSDPPAMCSASALRG